ncbi:MAG: fused MFS/spermidine synthase [Thermomicrobiales bacterium]|nr:fused MFS/spermidine synthase [Thermomicrobiales bacterium]MCO5221655.1 fused MFS/spermidine synthase [Thermomicrobiales bacterium]
MTAHDRTNSDIHRSVAQATSASSVGNQAEIKSAAPNAAHRYLLLLLVFLCGGVSIGTELAMSRLLAPYFGTSTFIWANLIGLTLAFLAVGYWLGGKLADRQPSMNVMLVIAGVAGFSVALIPVIAKPILRISLDAFDDVDVGAFFGSLFAALFLMAIPMLLFGCISPFAIRMRTQNIRSSGATAGNIYALSTVGSILGSFLPVLVLIPLFGTRATFLMMGAALMVLALIGLVVDRGGSRIALVGVLLVAAPGVHATTSAGDIKPPYRGILVEEAESEYNYIQILDDNGRILLALNDGHAIHSIYDPDSVLTGGPWDYFLLAPAMTGIDPERALIVGLAGGTSAHSLLDTYPGLEIDGVEIDPEILELARTYFALDDPRLRTHADDGRYFLETTDSMYDLIALDAYRQPYIPFHLATEEFFQLVEEHLNPGGVVVVNVGRSATDFRLVDALSSTLATVFPSVWLVDVQGYDNTMVFASNEPVTLDDIREHLGSTTPGSNQQIIAAEVFADGNLRANTSTMTPYTDDRAPVETLIDQMIFDAAREETSE